MTIMSDEPIGDDSRIPQPALILGVLGVIPFIACGVAAIALTDPYWSAFAVDAVRYYGAVILSFLGGIRWGLAIQPFNKDDLWFQLALSVAPSLFAWGALLVPGQIGIAMLILGLVGMLAADVQFVNQGRAPQWFSKLRLWLTVGACSGLLMIAL
ncbi:MAG: DUF3429 domain-containing protein [Pseudomonadota bacterium]